MNSLSNSGKHPTVVKTIIPNMPESHIKGFRDFTKAMQNAQKGSYSSTFTPKPIKKPTSIPNPTKLTKI